MITERKAIQEMFDDLQREKKELKANYREDMARIEERQDGLLSRLERLDGLEREAVDPEGIIGQLTEVMTTLGNCIPDIPAGDLLQATAEKMAAAAIESGNHIYKSEPEADKDNQRHELIEKEAKYLHSARPTKVEEVITEIENILIETPYMRTADIEKALKERHGWEWLKFGAVFSNYRAKYNTNIEKAGQTYFVRREANSGENRDQRNRDGQTDTSPQDQTI